MNLDELAVMRDICNDIDCLKEDEIEEFHNQIQNLAIELDLGQDARGIKFIGGSKDELMLPVVCKDGIPSVSSMWRPIPMAWKRGEVVPHELYEYDIVKDSYMFQGKLDVRKMK